MFCVLFSGQSCAGMNVGDFVFVEGLLEVI